VTKDSIIEGEEYDGEFNGYCRFIYNDRVEIGMTKNGDWIQQDEYDFERKNKLCPDPPKPDTSSEEIDGEEEEDDYQESQENL
jgi:hypothetical protein